MHENIIRRTAKPGNTPTGGCQNFIVLYIFRLESKTTLVLVVCFSGSKAMLFTKQSYALLQEKLCFAPNEAMLHNQNTIYPPDI